MIGMLIIRIAIRAHLSLCYVTVLSISVSLYKVRCNMGIVIVGLWVLAIVGIILYPRLVDWILKGYKDDGYGL